MNPRRTQVINCFVEGNSIRSAFSATKSGRPHAGCPCKKEGGRGVIGARLLKFPILAFNQIGQPTAIYLFCDAHVGNFRLASMLFGDDDHLRVMRRREHYNKGVRA